MSLNHPNRNKGVAVYVYKKEYEDLLHLLLHRFHPWVGWGILKGGCEGHSERFTLKKEIREEVQLIENRDYFNNDVHRIEGLRIRYTTPRHRKMDYQVYVVKVNPQAVAEVDFEESDKYCWAKFEKAKGMLRHETNKIALEKVNDFVKTMQENSVAIM